MDHTNERYSPIEAGQWYGASTFLWFLATTLTWLDHFGEHSFGEHSFGLNLNRSEVRTKYDT